MIFRNKIKHLMQVKKYFRKINFQKIQITKSNTITYRKKKIILKKNILTLQKIINKSIIPKKKIQSKIMIKIT